MKKLFLLLFILLTSQAFAVTTSWKGTTSTSWGTSANWTAGVPSATDDAIIGDASFTGSFQPTLSSTKSYCKSLTIGTGAVVSALSMSSTNRSLTVSGNITIGTNGSILQSARCNLSLTGNWINSGIYTASNSRSIVIFSGTAQSLTGVTTFRGLTVNAGSTVTLSNNISVVSSFTVSGTFNPVTYIVTLTGSTFLANYGGIVKVNASTFTGNYSITPTTIRNTSIIDYASSTLNQTVSALSYGTLKISGGTIKTVAGNFTTQSGTGAGNINITSGTLDLSTFTANRVSSGGALTVAAACTLKVAGTFPANYLSNSLAASSLVEYYGGNQTVVAKTYGHLTLSSSSGAVTKTMPATSMIIAGNLVSSASAGTLIFTGGNAITVYGSVTIGSSTTFNTASYIYDFRSNLNNSGVIGSTTSTITMSGYNAQITGIGTYNLNNLTCSNPGATAANNVQLGLSGNFATTGSGTFTHTSGGTATLTMTGTSKTINGLGIILDNIVVGGTITTTSDFIIAGNVTVNASKSFIASAGIITLKGVSKAITNANILTFYGLNIGATGTITTASNFNVSNDFTVLGTFNASAGTVSFIGTSVLTGSPNFYNVTINGTKLVLGGNDGVMGIANAFTITSGTFDVTTSVPNAVSYNGSGAQTVTATTYNKLIFANAGTKTAGGAVVVNEKITINASVIFAGSSFTHSIYGDWLNNGTYTAATSTVQFLGAIDTYITGATTFNIITLNKSTASTLLLLNDDVSVATINMTTGELHTGVKTVTITTTRAGNGIILGTITRTHAFTTGVSYAFESAVNTINFTVVSGVTSVTVTIAPGAVNDFPFVASVINREYDITIPAGTYTGTLRLHYVDSELNGNVEANMNLWHYSAGAWSQSGRSGIDNTANWVELNLLTSMTGRWALCDGNFNVVKWTGATNTNWATASNWQVVQGAPSTPPSANDIVQIGSAAFTNQPTISSAVSIKILVFYSTTASTLTLASGGSLTIASTISGDWTAGNAIHVINAGAQNITVGGDVLLSDGTTNHRIDLNVSTGTVGITNNLKQSGGANIIFSGAGNLAIGSDFTYTSGTFTCSTSTVTYNGLYTQLVAPVTYNNITFNKSSGTIALNTATVVNGNCTLLTGGRLDLNASLTVGGDVSIGAGTTMNANTIYITVGGNWTKTGTFIQGSGTVEFNGTGSQNINATTFNLIKINKTSGTALVTGNLLLDSDLNIAQGILDLGIYTANRTALGGTITLASGATLKVGGASNFPVNFDTEVISATSTIEYNGTVAQSVLALGYGNLVFSNGGATSKTLATPITISGDLTINSGATFNGGTNTVTILGNWYNAGTFSPATGAVVMNGTGKQITGTNSFYDIIINGSYATTGGTTTTVLGSLTNVGTFTQGSDQVYFYGNLLNTGTINLSGTTNIMGTQAQTIANNGSFVSGLTGVVNYNGTIAPSILSTSAAQYATVNINNTDPAGIVPIQPWQVIVAMNVASGAKFDGNGLTHTLLGSMTNNGTVVNNSGTFTFSPIAPATLNFGSTFSCSGTVNFAGAQPITIAGSGTPNFGVVKLTNSSAAGITPSSDWNIANVFFVGSSSTFHGGAARTITLASDITVNGIFDGGTSTVIMTDTAGIGGVGTITFNNITLNSVDSLLLDIGVTGNFVDNGVFNAAGFAVTFSGSGASTISGSTDPVTLSELIVSKSSATLTLAQNIIMDQDVTVSSGATFDGATKTITVGGNWMHNGTFAASTSSVVFNGIINQQINGSSVCSFYDVTVNNPGFELSIANNVNMVNRLTLAANSRINTTGFELVLLSTATNTGSIGTVPATATFVGNIRMQRYIPATPARYWHMAASPVTTGTVSMWQAGAPFNGFYVTGLFTGADNPGTGIASYSPNTYKWDAANGAWSAFPNTSNAAILDPKTGYCIYIRDGSASYNGGVVAAKTFSVVGPPNIGTQVYSLSYNTAGGTGATLGGWNLIANSFPSNITGTLSNAGWSNSGNMDGLGTYIWDSGSSSYVSCNGGVGSCTIPSSQAFWVRVKTGGGTVTATESVKVAGSIALYRTVAPTYIPVVLTNGETTKKDVTYLRFEDDATLGFDNQYDAYKLRMAITAKVNPVSISTEINKDTELSINARPVPKAQDTIALRTLGNTGPYTLDFSDKTNLDPEYKMILLDK